MPLLFVATVAAGAVELLPALAADAGQSAPTAELQRRITGNFQFLDSSSRHPITVWFCRPRVIGPHTRIVFVMHGSESRTAQQACDLASLYVQSLNALVLAPQFSEIQATRTCSAT
jgi:hypothetical protein